MSATTTLTLIALGVTIFFGLGGVSSAEALFGKARGKVDSIVNGDDVPESSRDAQNTTRDIPATPKQKDTQTKINRIVDVESPVTAAARRTATDLADEAKIDKRRDKSKNLPKFALKKSGKEVVKEKKRQEADANKVLKDSGATFGGIGKQGKKKLHGNTNFDLGLPSTATSQDRKKVIESRAERNARRKLEAKKRHQERQLVKKLEGKNQSDLKALAKKHGFAIHGNISDKALAKIFQARGIEV